MFLWFSNRKFQFQNRALCHIKPNIYIQKTKFASNKQYLLRLLSLRNAKKTQTDPSIPRVFLLCLKRNNGQTFKSGSCNNSVCYSHNFLQWMFFIEKLKDIAFHESLSLLLDCLKRYVAAFLEASLLQEVRISCVISAITIWC